MCEKLLTVPLECIDVDIHQVKYVDDTRLEPCTFYRRDRVNDRLYSTGPRRAADHVMTIG